jgi:hypothetical protein
MFGPPFVPSEALGVLHWLNSPFSSISSLREPERVFRPPSTSAIVGVGHGDPIEPVPLVWSVDGASRYIDRFDGVSFRFQISADSVEPTVANFAANLLAHDDPEPAGADESK